MKSIKALYRLVRKKIGFVFSVNWVKTFYFNFKMFPFNDAIKFPVLFYENVKLTKLGGEIKVLSPVKMGMIGIGQKFEKFSRSKGKAEIILEGKVIFKGSVHFGKDVTFFVGRNAVSEFGEMACLGSDVKFICTEHISLGDWAGIGYESQLSDSNFHPFKDLENNIDIPIRKCIKIASHNAISNRVTILPGTITPEHCVIASNSICNSDYTEHGEKILLGGSPAKLIKRNYIRDWEAEKDKLIKAKVFRS